MHTAADWIGSVIAEWAAASRPADPAPSPARRRSRRRPGDAVPPPTAPPATTLPPGTPEI